MCGADGDKPKLSSPINGMAGFCARVASIIYFDIEKVEYVMRL
jgi:hypothetical protein